MRVVLSFLFWTYLALSSVALFFVALALWLLTWPFDRNGRLLHLFTCAWGAHYLYLNPLWRFRVDRVAPVDRRRPFVLVANHQSFGDILAVGGTYLPFKWVSKQSVFRVPFIGWNCRLNRYVPLIRGDKASVERMFATCRCWLARGVSVAFFPEGTRSRDGEVQPFKPGAFQIACDAGVPILPVIVDGTGEVLPKHGMVFRRNATARVRVLAPIVPRPGAAPEELAAEVRAVMVAELARMRGHAADAIELRRVDGRG